jgi:hypothetical protein
MIECPTKPTQQRFKWVLRSLPSANTIKTEVLSPKNDFSPLCMSSGVERERETFMHSVASALSNF